MNREEFLRRRKSGIGGSDVAAVMGVSQWRTPYQLYLDKTSDAIDDRQTMRLEAGNRLEPVIADWISDIHPDWKIQRRNGLFRHPEHPELIADIDRYIVGGGILECKTYTGYDRDRFGESQTDNLPDEYLLQVQHYMHVTGYHSATLAVLIHGWELREYHVEYDRELAEFVAEKCVEFWQKFVLKRQAPPPCSRDNLADYYTAKAGASIVADSRAFELVELAKLKKAEIKTNEEQFEELTAELKGYMGECEILTGVDGKPLATWRQSKDREIVSVDWQSIAAECGIPADVIAKHTTVSTKRGNRPLLLK